MKLSDEWSTPDWLFDQLNEIYGPFELDVCADDDNAKCDYFFNGSKDNNALDLPWSIHENRGTKAWMNPPYSNPRPWVEKALNETNYGVTTAALLPVDPSTKWFQLYISYEKRAKIVEVFPWRIKFIPPKKWKGAVSGPRGSHMLVLFTPNVDREGIQLEVPDERDNISKADTGCSIKTRKKMV